VVEAVDVAKLGVGVILAIFRPDIEVAFVLVIVPVVVELVEQLS
jgi:hypothetical protein